MAVITVQTVVHYEEAPLQLATWYWTTYLLLTTTGLVVWKVET